MKEKTIYIAEDGREFEYEADCMDYEIKLILEAMPKGSLRFYNKDKKEVSFDYPAQQVYYIVITDKQAVPCLDIWGEKHDIYIPFDFDTYNIDKPCGIYYWDNNCDFWIEYKEAKQNFDEIWEGFADAV